MKRNNILILLCIFLIIPLSAQESSADLKQESVSSEYKQVNGLENWTYDYDISGLKDGKYNLIIRSRDTAGNLSIDGPINIFIDSESDLPVVSISSPSQFMRVGGDLHIVGTASDDDEISFVEIKIDDGPFKRVEGTQFWSFYLDISSIPDGRHAISARATDINGLSGEEFTAIINVDKTRPLITIDSHKNGEIISGRKNISGFVNDANGVTKLE